MRILLKVILAILLVVFIGSNQIITVWAQEDSEDKLYLFVSQECPYCAMVEEFVQDNNLSDKVEILDVGEDPSHAALYNQLFEEAGVPIEDRGDVPVLFEGDEYFEGADQIKLHLAEKFDISIEDTDDNEIPDNGKETRIILAILGGGIFLSLVFLYVSGKKEK